MQNMPVEDNEHILGNKKAPITLIAYMDFESPACHEIYNLLKETIQINKNLVRLIFRHFTFKQINPHAYDAALASEAAGKQGKFWEIADIFFANPIALTDANIIIIAKKLNLDIYQFDADMNSNETRDKLDNNLKSAIKYGVNSAPTIFINGTLYTGPKEINSLQNAIDSQFLKK